MKNLNKKRILTSLGIFIFLFTFSIIGLSEVQALEFKPQVGIPDTMFATTVSMEGNNSGTSLIAEFVKAIYNYGVSIGAILAAIMLMAGGLIWLTSGGSQEKVSKAKDIIFGSVIGLFLLIGAYTILNTVNPNLVALRAPTIGGVLSLKSGCCLPPKKDGQFIPAINGNQIDCYNHLISHGAIEEIKEENKINDKLLELNVFYPNQQANLNNDKCVFPGCCELTWEYKEMLGTTHLLKFYTKLPQDVCSWYPTHSANFIKTSDVVDMNICDENPACINNSWGDTCTNDPNILTRKNNRVCWCFDGNVYIGIRGKIDEPCGTEKGAICITGDKCRDGFKRDRSGRGCATGFSCCYRDI